MSWKRRIVGVLVLAVLTGAPAAGTACALLCQTAAGAPAADGAATSLHGSGGTCKEAPDSSARVRIRGVSSHDCGVHDGALRDVSATIASARADSASVVRLLVIADLNAPFGAPSSSEPDSACSSPPGTAPPTTTTPLVLRV